MDERGEIFTFEDGLERYGLFIEGYTHPVLTVLFKDGDSCGGLYSVSLRSFLRVLLPFVRKYSEVELIDEVGVLPGLQHCLCGFASTEFSRDLRIVSLTGRGKDGPVRRGEIAGGRLRREDTIVIPI